MQLDETKTKKILVDQDFVSAEDMAKAEDFVKKNGGSVIDYLISSKLISVELIGQAMAEFYGVAFANVKANSPSLELINKIPPELARRYRIVISIENAEGLVIATDDPTQKPLVNELAKLFPGKKIWLAYALPQHLEEIFLSYRKPLETRFADIIKNQQRVAPEIISEIFEDAIAFNASDIHFEPQEKEVVVRFRVDGVLHEAGRIPKQYYENIVNRIKVQTKMRIDEHFAAQDGAMHYVRGGGETVDMRVSVVPTLEGEKIVIRLLSAYIQTFGMGDLGFSKSDQLMFEKAVKKPFGMILVTGPTGSGKTTTLYAALKALRDPGVNITTIEDPVEYRILGINQIQVNKETDLTFADGLRSIVRQDPDIILVGEIRDKETAEIGVNAALTGHLLLSTFHANDAATGIPRLLDMGVEPFLLASTLEIVMAQRLVRNICMKCRYSKQYRMDELQEKVGKNAGEYFGNGESVTLYAGKGCTACSNTGFKGRTAIFEFIDITPEMKDLILKNPSTQEIWKLARTQGAHTLFEDGVEKVKSGITTLDELLRVALPPNFISQTAKDETK